MAVLTKEDFNELVKKLVGDDSSDEAIKAVEDLTDTYNSLSVKDDTDWKAKYEENDASWRQKYKDRFFAPQDDKDIDNSVPPPQDQKPITELTYDKLFKED